MTSVVQPDAPELPADADALRALVLAMMAEREALTAGRDTLQAQNERLDVIPAQFRVIVTRRPKLACRACPGTVCRPPRRRG
jgi:hypothetical protein